MFSRFMNYFLSRELGVSVLGGLVPTVCLGAITMQSNARLNDHISSSTKEKGDRRHYK